MATFPVTNVFIGQYKYKRSRGDGNASPSRPLSFLGNKIGTFPADPRGRQNWPAGNATAHEVIFRQMGGDVFAGGPQVGSLDAIVEQVERQGGSVSTPVRSLRSIPDTLTRGLLWRVTFRHKIASASDVLLRRFITQQATAIQNFFHTERYLPGRTASGELPYSSEIYLPYEKALAEIDGHYLLDALVFYDGMIPTATGNRATLLTTLNATATAGDTTITLDGNARDLGFRIGMVCCIGALSLVTEVLSELIKITGVTPGSTTSTITVEQPLIGTYTVTAGPPAQTARIVGFLQLYQSLDFVSIVPQYILGEGGRAAVLDYVFQTGQEPLIVDLNDAGTGASWTIPSGAGSYILGNTTFRYVDTTIRQQFE